MEYTLIENPAENRFEIHVDGMTAYIEYEIRNGKIYLTHTIVPPELGGRGIGSALVKQSLERIEKQGLKVVPVCSFVEAWFNKHPEKKNLLA